MSKKILTHDFKRSTKTPKSYTSKKKKTKREQNKLPTVQPNYMKWWKEISYRFVAMQLLKMGIRIPFTAKA